MTGLESRDLLTDVKRRQLGSYYTPKKLTQALSAWAVQSPTDTVLEPCFGGCQFFQALEDRFRELGSKQPVKQISGSDIDAAAFDHLSELFGLTEISRKFLSADFLSLGPSDFNNAPFDALVGNPPFVRHHLIPRLTKDTISKFDVGQGLIPRTAGLWAYFVLHSLQFLKTGGRLAYVVPASILFADYASPLLRVLQERFRFLRILRLGYAAFKEEGAAERVCLLLLSGLDQNEATIDHKIAGASAEDKALIRLDNLSSGSWYPLAKLGRDTSNLILEETPAPFVALKEHKSCLDLGAIARIEIGLVTGANQFFVLNRSAIEKHELPEESLHAVVARAVHLEGIAFSRKDQNQLEMSDARCWLLAPNDLGPKGSALRRYFATVPKERRRNTAWFRKRKNWYCPDSGELPDAILTYMNHVGPRLILSGQRTNCTNTLHKVHFETRLSAAQKKLIALSFLTSFSQLSAEFLGRTYGSGLLKLEPKEARLIRLLMPECVLTHEVDSSFRLADVAIRSGNWSEAMMIADRTILMPIFGDNYEDCRAILVAALKNIRDSRLCKPAAQSS